MQLISLFLKGNTFKIRTSVIKLEESVIPITGTMKYLGIVIDENLLFKEHVKYVAEKAQRTCTLLSRLMPNVGGPSELRRKLLLSVVISVFLYGAPVWAGTLKRGRE